MGKRNAGGISVIENKISHRAELFEKNRIVARKTFQNMEGANPIDTRPTIKAERQTIMHTYSCRRTYDCVGAKTDIGGTLMK